MTRGTLRVLLGAAPGVGKTYAMLQEGHQLAAEGRDVVLALVETHDREPTAALVDGLEMVPRRGFTHRGVQLSDMDLAAVLARAPEIALVDELAHTNVGTGGNEKRWQDVHALLDAGIDVISTVNVQHIESLGDVVRDITGAAQRETIPDAVLRAADAIELVDLTPQALRARLGEGLIYPPGRIDAALSNYFRLGNLTALREIALLWLADEVDSALEKYRAEHGISTRWETRERVMVALTGGAGGRDAAAPRGAHRRAQQRRGTLRGACHGPRRAARRAPQGAGGPAPARRTARRHLPPGDRRGRSGRAGRVRAGLQRHAAGHRRLAPLQAGHGADRARHRGGHRAPERGHRRAHGQPRGRRLRAPAAALPRGADPGPDARRVRAGAARRAAADLVPDAGCRPRTTPSPSTCSPTSCWWSSWRWSAGSSPRSLPRCSPG